MCASKFPIWPKVKAGETYYYCTCGRSTNQPWCDGKHTGTTFKPLAWKAEKDGAPKMCQCKSTRTPPLCDNTHMKLVCSCCSGVSVKKGELYQQIK